ncbi:hypothetical protein B0T22DRAFT_464468 [Podospora appendiculata]|uniref:Uncharacterized protein n=1 Tax=Podospora appendiculata TaxID=314037 RepID=A0AAE1C9V3_9PEZI|nr:hypothetical protein B0T22DRAFT_464468 [Podospora appendiculata]
MARPGHLPAGPCLVNQNRLTWLALVMWSTPVQLLDSQPDEKHAMFAEKAGTGPSAPRALEVRRSSRAAAWKKRRRVMNEVERRACAHRTSAALIRHRKKPP